MVFEAQGGVESRAAAILHRIAEAVATAEGLDSAGCKRAMLEKLAIIVARAHARAVRRRASRTIQLQTDDRGVKRIIAEISLESSEASGNAELFF